MRHFWMHGPTNTAKPRLVRGGEVVKFESTGDHEFVAHKRKGEWSVTDGKSGLTVSGRFAKKEDAIDNARERLAMRDDLEALSEAAYQRNKELIDAFRGLKS